jgi:hypothetical protein
VPVVLSTNPQRNRNFIRDVTKLFPGREVFARAGSVADEVEREILVR